jgi:hypothetical protein
VESNDRAVDHARREPGDAGISLGVPAVAGRHSATRSQRRCHGRNYPGTPREESRDFLAAISLQGRSSNHHLGGLDERHLRRDDRRDDAQRGADHRGTLDSPGFRHACL